MAAPSAAEGPARTPGVDAGIYLDASALAKLYLPEAESDAVDAFLRGRHGLMLSDLAITEVLSAVGRRMREKELSGDTARAVREALLDDAGSGAFARLELSPAVHREAERLLLTVSISLRTLDALHLALAICGAASHVLTFDVRMREAAAQAGLEPIDLPVG